MRKKDDPWNAIGAGATTSAILATRAGWKVMGRQAMIGGVILVVIEGLGIVLTKYGAQAPVMADPPGLAPFGGQSYNDSLADRETTHDRDDNTFVGTADSCAAPCPDVTSQWATSCLT